MAGVLLSFLPLFYPDSGKNARGKDGKFLRNGKE
jgi:hypothetical protein